MTSGDGLQNERLRFIKHKGHAIYEIDFSNCTPKELFVLLDLIRADIARHEPGSVHRSTRTWLLESRKFSCSTVLM
jgi:hypothetical protein